MKQIYFSKYWPLLVIIAVFVYAHSSLASDAKSKEKVAASTPAGFAPNQAKQDNPKIQQQTANSQVNPVTQAALQAGVLRSINRINQVMDYLTRGAQSGAYIFVHRAAPDQRIFSVSLEVTLPDAPPIYASASFAPNQSGLSDAVYDTVEYVKETRDSVARRLFKDARPTSVLRKDIFLYDTGPVKFFLMPAGKDGCVVIKKEVVQ